MAIVSNSYLPAHAGGISALYVIDLNGDGRDDVIVGYASLDPAQHAFPIRALVSTGNGLQDGTAAIFGGNVPIVDAPNNSSAPVDLNGDGKLDFLIANGGLDSRPWPGAEPTLILSQGSGYANVATTLGKSFAHSIAYGDIDGDGDVDAFLGNIFGASMAAPYFVINDGRGQFTKAMDRLPEHASTLQYSYTACALTDVDGDRDLDLVLGRGDDNSLSRVLLNEGGRFIDGQLLPGNPNPNGAADPVVNILVADLNGDGRSDLILNTAVNNYDGGGHFQVLINYNGQYSDETVGRLIIAPDAAGKGMPMNWFYRPTLADVNNDGFIDILVGSGSNTPILVNDGAGRFYALPTVVGNRYQQVVAGDFNGDDLTDLLYYRHRGEQANPDEHAHVIYGQRVETFQTGDAGANGLLGTAGNDALGGLSGNDLFLGYAGNDRMDGGDGADRVHGGLGNDTMDGGAEQDYLRGEEGDDSLIGGAAWDDLHGNMGNDIVRGGDGDDWVVGGKDLDVLFGDDGNDIVVGNLGEDTLEGGAGDDRMHGGQGGDILHGGGGNDLLLGDRGDDTITGGAGADQFWTHADAGADRVLDFNGAEGDRIKVEYGAVTISQVGQDTTLSFGTGSQMVLVGVTNFAQGWILTG